ncbi:MAG: hypothetical protein COB67_13035 [SAR324 cluster bacterium]|uniref:Sulfatase-modifying factor enzyme-like domain-containing protein n=1 Tax=SAR324 cluster bacterium TaxID=2024889 RepID=A0A2A4SPW6_9DELT|nr:MAG: hypothetical protein COB67_13035 [SAR324 cluster bacterium]
MKTTIPTYLFTTSRCSFFLLLLCGILSSCTTLRKDWVQQEGNQEIYIIGPVYDWESSTSYQSSLLLKQSIYQLLAQQTPFEASQNGRNLVVRRIDWALHPKILGKIYQQLRKQLRVPEDSSAEKLAAIFEQFPSLSGKYLLFLEALPAEALGKFVIQGIRVIPDTGRYLELSQFRAELSGQVPELANELAALLGRLISSKDHGMPDLSRNSFEFIKGGCYQTQSQPGRPESQQIEVCVSDIYLSRYPVTVAQWDFIMSSPKMSHEGEGNLPVTNVPFAEIQRFLNRLSEKTGFQYRLPTEAEWEFACISRQNTVFPLQKDEPIRANWLGTSSQDSWLSRSPVGSFPANQLGLFDMKGNVWEWTQSPYLPIRGLGAWEKFRYTLQNSSSRYVLKGGSFDTPAGQLTCASRQANAAQISNEDMGFRLALVPWQEYPLKVMTLQSSRE